jgi:hypothetical protein
VRKAGTGALLASAFIGPRSAASLRFRSLRDDQLLAVAGLPHIAISRIDLREQLPEARGAVDRPGTAEAIAQSLEIEFDQQGDRNDPLVVLRRAAPNMR